MSTIADEKWQMKIKSISEAARHIYNTKEFSDVKFKVRGVIFDAHKLILSARSSKFASLLMSSDASNKIDVDEKSPVTVTGFEILLRFIYTNEVGTEDKESIIEAHRCANYYSQKALQDICMEKIKSWEINDLEVCFLLDIGSDVEVLVEMCISFIRSNAKKVTFSNGFKEAKYKTISLILAKGALKSISVLDRIECLATWGKNHCQTSDYSLVRQKFLNDENPILGLLEFENLNLQELPTIPITYPKLLTAEEITMFLVYSAGKDRSVLPSWCIPVNLETPGNS